MTNSPTATFSGAQLAQLRRPVVYVLRDAEGSALYVGIGTNGVMRPFDPLHHAIAEIADTDRLDVYACDSAEEATALEHSLINALCPTRNRQIGRAAPARHGAETGIRRSGRGWQAYVKLGRSFVSKTFPIGTRDRNHAPVAPENPPRVEHQPRRDGAGCAGRSRLRLWDRTAKGPAMIRLAAVALLLSLGQSPIPIANHQDERTAQWAISEDGKRLTARRPAPDDVELCVEPKEFGRVICFTVGEIRSGKVVRSSGSAR
jgi:hypothetical protein